MIKNLFIVTGLLMTIFGSATATTYKCTPNSDEWRSIGPKGCREWCEVGKLMNSEDPLKRRYCVVGTSTFYKGCSCEVVEE